MPTMHDIRSAPVRTVLPTLLPITLEEAKDELDIIDDTSMDVRITNLIRAAVDIFERDTQRVLMSQTWQLNLDGFPCGPIELCKVPVAAVSFVKYITGGTLTTLSTSLYETDLVTEPCRVMHVSTSYWPTTDITLNAVTVEWTAGYASQALVPAGIKDVIKYIVLHLFRRCDLSDNYWTMIRRYRADWYF